MVNCNFGTEFREDRTYHCKTVGCSVIAKTPGDPSKIKSRCRGAKENTVYCSFDTEVWADDLYHCKNCGRASQFYIHDEGVKDLKLSCSFNGVTKAPKLLKRVANFTLAGIKHIVSGFPTCSQEQIDSRFALCSACNWFNGEICTHKNCGCEITNEQKYLSKLAWKSESCPIGKWVALD